MALEDFVTQMFSNIRQTNRDTADIEAQGSDSLQRGIFGLTGAAGNIADLFQRQKEAGDRAEQERERLKQGSRGLDLTKEGMDQEKALREAEIRSREKTAALEKEDKKPGKATQEQLFYDVLMPANAIRPDEQGNIIYDWAYFAERVPLDRALESLEANLDAAQIPESNRARYRAVFTQYYNAKKPTAPPPSDEPAGSRLGDLTSGSSGGIANNVAVRYLSVLNPGQHPDLSKAMQQAEQGNVTGAKSSLDRFIQTIKSGDFGNIGAPSMGAQSKAIEDAKGIIYEQLWARIKEAASVRPR